MEADCMSKVEQLIKRGVKITNPQSIEIGSDVNINNISSNGVELYSGCKIYGANTVILENSKIGYEAPATIERCQRGAEVQLAGGYFRKSVFLNKAKAGSGSHVREGTIFEEEAKIAHTVGLKQTILFPFVTLGSLINFCDCLMAGGTSREKHSEVGSSFIHFNYTPNQEKATPSIMGDVPNGVMLNKKPIFLGGQGGLVGPCRLAFGTVTAAGLICKKDELNENRLIIGASSKKEFSVSYDFIKAHTNIKRIVVNNINYLANLIALEKWYEYIRYQFISEEFNFTRELYRGLMENIDLAIIERRKRFRHFAEKMPDLAYTENEKIKLLEKWHELEEFFSLKREREQPYPDRTKFIKVVETGIKKYKRGQRQELSYRFQPKIS